VLLQHGFGSSRCGTKVRRFAETLENHDVPWAAADFTAHGDSTGQAHDLSIARLLDDVGSTVEHLRSEQGWTGSVALAGSSMGGVSVAWAAAERLPATAGLFLVAPAMRLTDRLLQSLEPGQAEDWEASGRIARDHRGWKHELGWELVADWRRRDHAALAPRLEMPVTLVQGALDDRVPLADARAFAGAVPDAVLVEVPDGDHRLHDHLPLLERELLRWLDRLA
jgi:pimeloyl-ACP methyl ester carboxylesterase